MPNPNFVAGGPPGWVVAAFQYAVGRPDQNSTTTEQIRLANQAGYTADAGYTRSQQVAVGQGLLSFDEFALGQGGRPTGVNRITPGPPTTNLPTTTPQPAPPFYPPSTTVYYPPPDPPQPPPSQPPQPPRGTPPINPNAPPASTFPSMWPYVIGQVAGPTVLDSILNANQYANAVWSVILGGPRPIPKGPKSRTPPKGPRPMTRDEIGRAYWGDEWNRPPPKAPVERIPRAERVASVLGTLGGDIYVNPKRLPVPRVPTSRPVAAPPPKTPLWLTLLPIVGPSLLGFLRPDQGDRNILRLTDPLTQPQTPGLTSTYTSVQSYGAFGGSGAVGTNTCECKAPRKKRRKKKRTVCYSGTYIERADGTRKSKKRKVQCL